MPAYRTAATTYAIQSYGRYSTGAVANVANSGETNYQGPWSYGGTATLERPPGYPIEQLLEEAVVGPDTGPITPGGAVAGGTGPVARVPNAVGGADTGGTGPITRAPIAQGGASAGGTGQLIVVPIGVGGALAGGTGPGELIGAGDIITPGGAIAAGVGPVARIVVAVGGATAGGINQTAVRAFVIGPGGAIAGGTGPTDSGPPVTPTHRGQMRVLVAVDEMPIVGDQAFVLTLR